MTTPPTLEQIARETAKAIPPDHAAHYLERTTALILQALQTATKQPQGADWAEAAAKEIRQTHYAFNPDMQMVGPLAAIIRKHAPLVANREDSERLKEAEDTIRAIRAVNVNEFGTQADLAITRLVDTYFDAAMRPAQPERGQGEGTT